MDRVERGLTVEPEPEAEEPFTPAFGLDRREVVEVLLVLAVVVVLAAATSVILVPA